MPFGIQPIHLILVVIVALIIFGPSRLPEIGRGLGKALNEFRRGTQEMTDSFREEVSGSANEDHPNTIASPPAPPQSQPISGGNFCTECGRSNPPGAKFCNNCGAALPQA